MIYPRTFIAAVILLVGLAFFARYRPTGDSSSSHVINPDQADLNRAAGQLMMVGFHGPELTPAIRDTLRELHPGGICLYAQNITSAQQVGKLNDDLRLALDDWMPPFTRPMDTAPIRAAVVERAPAAEFVEMGYLEGRPIFDGP